MQKKLLIGGLIASLTMGVTVADSLREVTKELIDILPCLKTKESYRAQSLLLLRLSHLSGFLLLTTNVVHFTS